MKRKQQQWIDVSTFSRDDQNRQPHTFVWDASEKAGTRCEVTVHRSRFFAPGDWVVSFLVGGSYVIDGRVLKSSELEDAKREALELAASYVQRIHAVFEPPVVPT